MPRRPQSQCSGRSTSTERLSPSSKVCMPANTMSRWRSKSFARSNNAAARGVAGANCRVLRVAATAQLGRRLLHRLAGGAIDRLLHPRGNCAGGGQHAQQPGDRGRRSGAACATIREFRRGITSLGTQPQDRRANLRRQGFRRQVVTGQGRQCQRVGRGQPLLQRRHQIVEGGTSARSAGSRRQPPRFPPDGGNAVQRGEEHSIRCVDLSDCDDPNRVAAQHRPVRPKVPQ